MRTSPLITLAVVLTALELFAAGQNIPTDWLTIQGSAFSFRVPPDMTNAPLQEHGGYIPGCVNSNIVLTFAYYPDPGGTVKDRPFDGPACKRTITAIDGRAARLESYHMVHPYFLNVGKTNVIRLYAKNGSNALNVVTYCHSEADYATSQRVFQSIRFKKE